MVSSPSVVWFRRDLRLDDNPALVQATKRGGPVIPLFIWSPAEGGEWAVGSASKWWLHHALSDLAYQLGRKKSRLIIRQGEPLTAIREIVKEVGAQAVFWNRLYEPQAVQRDQIIKEKLKLSGIMVESCNGSLLYEPWQIMNKAGKPFQVFTPFWNCLLEKGDMRQPAPRASKLEAPQAADLASLAIEELQLLPKINWTATMAQVWSPDRRGAEAALDSFCQEGLFQYGQGRDRPDQTLVSRLSPYLHFGQIGVLEIWHRVKLALEEVPGKKQEQASKNAAVYLKEIGWREFAHHLLFHFPQTTDKPLRQEFAGFVWQKNKAALKAWQKGQTGYPMVDAGMRELWATGWMHNRVRMIVASFLVKDLLISWLDGAHWFWDTLVDADLAANTLGWQWTAGCGADAQPYFRIFNPVSQGQKFDPEGSYVRKWIPEIAALPKEVIHCPWQAESDQLTKANVRLGRDYPKPIVDHSLARMRALAALKSMKEDK